MAYILLNIFWGEKKKTSFRATLRKKSSYYVCEIAEGIPHAKILFPKRMQNIVKQLY